MGRSSLHKVPHAPRRAVPLLTHERTHIERFSNVLYACLSAFHSHSSSAVITRPLT